MERENFVICWDCGDFFDIEKSIYDKEFNICDKCINANYDVEGQFNDCISSDDDSYITIGEHDDYDYEYEHDYECNDNKSKICHYDSDDDLNSYTIYTN